MKRCRTWDDVGAVEMAGILDGGDITYGGGKYKVDGEDIATV